MTATFDLATLNVGDLERFLGEQIGHFTMKCEGFGVLQISAVQYVSSLSSNRAKLVFGLRLKLLEQLTIFGHSHGRGLGRWERWAFGHVRQPEGVQAMIYKTGVAAIGIAACLIVPASAQTPAPAAGVTSGESLSSKLNKSDGVIKPSNDVDPGMKVPAPDPHPNSMPVIPPSATDGGSAK